MRRTALLFAIALAIAILGAGPVSLSLRFTRVRASTADRPLIVGLLARARKEHRTVRAFGLSEHYREIFRITRLSDFMEIVEGDAA